MVVRSLFLLCATSAVSASPILIDGNGKMLGYYLGAPYPSWDEHAVSVHGYRFQFERSSGQIEAPVNAYLGFTNADCTGELRTWTVAPGFVVPIIDGEPSAGLAYVPQDAEPQPVAILSVRNSDGCSGPPYPITNSLPALPNDPEVTGVSSAILQKPLRVSSILLFRDGFGV